MKDNLILQSIFLYQGLEIVLHMIRVYATYYMEIDIFLMSVG